MTTTNVYEWEKTLTELPLVKTYKELDSVVNQNSYKNEGATILSSYGRYPEVCDLCIKFARNFKKLSEIIKDATYNGKKRFGYLNLWLFDEIRKINNTSDILGDKSDIISKFRGVWVNINHTSSPKCGYEYYSSIYSLKEWKELKDLIYEEYKGKCIIQKNEKCPDFLNFEESFKNIKPLNELLCKQFQKDRETLEMQDQAGKPEHSADPGDGHTVGSSLFGDMKDYENTSDLEFLRYRIIITCLSFSGIFFILLLLYKITPLGSLLYERVFKKNKMRRDINYEASQEFSSDNSLSIYSRRINPHIAYHPPSN
ncbi:PIR Superfamily Protein [Plasmodium ovale curtisi]|uniref:PIR Superfamily Protein n=1 Tax=Plasmodium ovale curtisi TaxID=864141 RepID=A0A1A8XF07_PLAOA|nr:PIR Superfamily Protein [Plasmodium ovale curtisi]SBT02939.1 PIR Superfamily Protein [Plasmodium ovale curtisi]